MNPVVIAVALMLVLSLLRINVVVSPAIGAIVVACSADSPSSRPSAPFTGGWAACEISSPYAMLGLSAVAISRSGITDCWPARSSTSSAGC